MHLYTSWSSGQNSVEQTAKAKTKILQSMQENKMLNSGDRVGIKKKVYGENLQIPFKEKNFKKKIKTFCNYDNQVII